LGRQVGTGRPDDRPELRVEAEGLEHLDILQRREHASAEMVLHVEDAALAVGERELDAVVVEVAGFRQAWSHPDYSSGSMRLRGCSDSAKHQLARSSSRCRSAHFSTRRRAAGGNDPQRHSPVRMWNLASSEAWYAWKCGGAWSLWYMAMTMPENLLISGTGRSLARPGPRIRVRGTVAGTLDAAGRRALRSEERRV